MRNTQRCREDVRRCTKQVEKKKMAVAGVGTEKCDAHIIIHKTEKVNKQKYTKVTKDNKMANQECVQTIGGNK